MTPESYRDTGRAGDLVPEHFTPEPSLRPLHAAADREPRWQYVLQASAECDQWPLLDAVQLPSHFNSTFSFCFKGLNCLTALGMMHRFSE